MNVVAAQRGSRDDAHLLVGKGVPSGTWTANVTSPATVVDADTGEALLVTARYPGDLTRFRRAARTYRMGSVVRSAGVRNRANVFGYTSRHVFMQRNGCRLCHEAGESPEAHEGLVASGAVLSELFREVMPERAAADEAAAEAAILPDWRLPRCQWTSGVLNETSPLPYHYDRNNLATWSAMIVARRGVRGGFLHVPELDVTVECRDGDVVFFAGWHFVHGVTPMARETPDAYRYSAVFYTVSKMAHCLAATDEMAWARLDRTTREADLRDADERLGPRRG